MNHLGDQCSMENTLRKNHFVVCGGHRMIGGFQHISWNLVTKEGWKATSLGDRKQDQKSLLVEGNSTQWHVCGP